jgi:hypothetical protein
MRHDTRRDRPGVRVIILAEMVDIGENYFLKCWPKQFVE